MKFLLDTPVVSELVKPAPNAAVLSWLGQSDGDGLFLSVLTAGELERAIAKLTSNRVDIERCGVECFDPWASV